MRIHLVRTAFASTLALALFLLAGPASAQVAAGTGSAGVGGSTPLLTAVELQEHVAELASDALAGRRAGTPGAERAARYVVRRFQEAGLKAPASHPTYLQSFDFPIGVELGGDNRLVLQHGSRLGTIFTPGIDLLPLAGSVSDRVVQPVVFAGYGISAPSVGYDDYTGLDVEGKIVLVLRYSPEGDDPGGRFGPYLSERHKAATARARGARAILFVNGPATEEIDRLLPFDVDERPESLGIVGMSVTQGVARRIVAAGGEDLSMLQHRIDTGGSPMSRPIPGVVLNLRVDVEPRTRTTHNVIGIVPGRDPGRAGEAVVVGAHYDGLGLGGPGSLDPVPGRIHNGADDNASGVAALLELAEHFSYPTNRPARTVVFAAFGAEETGMLGSARFVSSPPVPLRNVVAMVNMDMIGRLRDELIVYGTGSSRSWPGLLEAISERAEIPIRMVPDAYGPSDHAAFYLRQVPVLSFFTGVHEDYHRSTDDPGRINLEGLRAVTELIRGVVSRLVNDGGRPAFDPSRFPLGEAAGEKPSEAVARGVRLGAIPASVDPEADRGVIVDAVVAGSPAAVAGIEPGDRIVEVSGRPVGSVYDYKRVLEEHAVGRPVRLVIAREGVRNTIVVDPELAEP